MNRRHFLLSSAGLPLLSMAACQSTARIEPRKIIGPTSVRAIAFDAFPIFDPRTAFAGMSELFPVNGDRLRRAWFAKLFAYTWLRTSGKRYTPFDTLMEDSLRVAAGDLGMAVSDRQRSMILASFRTLPVWPDVRDQLKTFRDQGLRIAFLSNMTEDMLRANMRHNQIEGLFDFVLSTDLAGAFKPAPAAYELAVDAFDLHPSEIAFAAFASWDAAGASWFGYRSAWINRLGAVPERLDAEDVVEGRDLSILQQLIGAPA